MGGGGPTHYRPYLRVYFSFGLVVLKGRLTFHYDPELDNKEVTPSVSWFIHTIYVVFSFVLWKLQIVIACFVTAILGTGDWQCINDCHECHPNVHIASSGLTHSQNPWHITKYPRFIYLSLETSARLELYFLYKERFSLLRTSFSFLFSHPFFIGFGK